MVLDAWLPVGYPLPDGTKSRFALFEGSGWQILETQGNGRALLASDELAQRWVQSGLLEQSSLVSFEFGNQRLWLISCGSSHVLCPVSEGKSPNTKNEALAFSLAFKATRDIDNESPLQDALYVERISRLLPTYSISSKTDDAIVLGYWLSGGASVSVKSFRRLSQTLSWLGAANLKDVVEAAGFEVRDVVPNDRHRTQAPKQDEKISDFSGIGKVTSEDQSTPRTFELPGRFELASFINEHIVDIVQNKERYKALGIDFPSAVALHGPPGCGKTFAVERLVDFLGWPSFQIDASSVASPYIHETSKKVADIFDKAMQNAPSVLIIDEMEAFLADREMGSGHHRVEEVAEFLRRIPEATKNEVLIVAMTNRIDMIDSAILRRGRFDHIIRVDYASEMEVLSLLEKLLFSLPKDEDVNVVPFVKEFVGRPLSDVAFVVREGARLAARSGKDRLNQDSLLAAMRSVPARERKGETQRHIGFI
ncbi:ATP-binding protein [Thiothrix lacustris]|uniref:ATP-binding protein n=1 Tax=Thiothrix lacustris TaxID=525917 RepID=UPI0027E545D5|nr:ATP-binding protein [Thiothrix lacustris]WMP18948.1 ATP-binding protein [Thiothrix lacustris]